ncbi:MAG: Ig domain-containing protein, partial [Muribaculaceae bacterium]
MRRFLLLFAAVFLSLSAVAEVTTLASWTFTSSSYPANKTAFAATDGTCLESTFYLDGTGSTWSSSKGYAFTAVTSITLTLRTTVAIPSNTVISFAADMFYNKSSNAPAKGYDLTVSENGGTATTTGLDVTSISLSDSKATKTVNYTTQTNLAVGATIELIYTQTGMVGSGQAYFGNIVISTEAELSGIDLLSFDESSVELYLDEKDTFTPPILSNADGLTINWESSDENVATVDDSGNVSIVGIGTTKITATEKENSSNSASYTITVKDPNAIEDDVIVHGIFDGNAGGAYANEGSYTSGNGIIYKAKYSNTNGIQLNKNNASPGIVVTENPHGYVISKIIVEWNLNCAADKDLEIIGSNEAFTGTTDLNATAVGATVKKGTLLGTLKSVNETEFDVLATGYYCYIGLRALAVVNINKITLVWTRVEPEFKAEITIAVDETEGDANKITFSGLQESHGLAFDFTGYSVYLNDTELGGYDETLSYLPFVPTGSFTISNGTYTYPVAVTWPITDFSTIKAKVADAG